MGFTPEIENRFREKYSACMCNFNEAMRDYGEKMIESMREKNPQWNDDELIEFAITGFLHGVKSRHGHFHGQQKALLDARELLTNPEGR